MGKLNRDSPLLITGSRGVLGTALIKILQSEGFTQLLTPERHEMDLLDPISTQAYLSRHRPQVITHLASFVFGLALIIFLLR